VVMVPGDFELDLNAKACVVHQAAVDTGAARERRAA
jgi:hypothetical protein